MDAGDARAWLGYDDRSPIGELVDAAPLPGFVALDGDQRVGLLSYIERGDGIEVATIQTLEQGRGVGRALMDPVYEHAVQRKTPRRWLITTNGNLRAFASYQHLGYRSASGDPQRSRSLPAGQAVDPHDRQHRHPGTTRVRVRTRDQPTMTPGADPVVLDAGAG